MAELQSERSVASVKNSARRRALPPIVADYEFEEASPYGLKGLSRDTLSLVKADCVTRLAISLALRGNSSQIRDPEFVSRMFLHHPEWLDEYHVVHLIEKSLWIDGRSDLVMTLTRNPSQIPDDPPPKVRQILTEAYTRHPRATVWYGVPLFGEEKTATGLPIPLSARDVRDEAERRLRTAQEHALRWGWFYRMLAAGARIPSLVWQEFVRTGHSLRNRYRRVSQTVQRLRLHARKRQRAECAAQLEYCRTGVFRPPATYDNLPWFERSVLQGLNSAAGVASVSGQVLAVSAPTAASGWAAYMIYLQLFTPALIVSCDPFLFLELPEEPGKLRHLAHWYWQEQKHGQRTLHLHA